MTPDLPPRVLSRNTLLLFLGLCTAAFAVRCLVPYYSPDSFSYVAVARGLVEGLGLSGRLVTVDSGVPRPLDLWPPAYPLALSAGMRLGLGPTASAVVVSVLSFLLCTFALLHVPTPTAAETGPSYNRTYAFILCALLLSYLPFRAVATQVWSEPLMIAFCAAGLALDARNDERHPLWAALCGACLGLGTLTRYLAGFALCAVLIRAAVDFLLEPARRRRIAAAVAALCLSYGAVVGPWLVRNHRLFGKLTGYPHAPRPGGLRSGIGAVLNGMENLMGDATLGVLGIALYALGVYRLIYKARSTRLLALALFPPLYVLGLMALSMPLRLDGIGPRLLAPLGVGLLPMVALSLAEWARRLHRDERAVARWAVGLGVALTLVQPSGRLALPKGLADYRQMDAFLIRWIEGHATPEDLLVGHGIWFLLPFTHATVMADGYPERAPLTEATLSAYVRREGGRWQSIYWISQGPCDHPPLPDPGFQRWLLASDGYFSVWKIALSEPGPGDIPAASRTDP